MIARAKQIILTPSALFLKIKFSILIWEKSAAAEVSSMAS